MKLTIMLLPAAAYDNDADDDDDNTKLYFDIFAVIIFAHFCSV